MKHLVLIILAALSVAAYAQSEHLTFKGVPIDGTLAEYTEKMHSITNMLIIKMYIQ